MSKKPSVLSKPIFNTWHALVTLVAIIAYATTTSTALLCVLFALHVLGLSLATKAQNQYTSY